MIDIVERLKRALADRYTIEREPGAGGMATVYVANDVKHHRRVAVKVLRSDLAACSEGSEGQCSTAVSTIGAPQHRTVRRLFVSPTYSVAST